MSDLNEHGSASRCLLRLREDRGNPVMSDERFIDTYRDRFPDWDDHPGALDADGILALATEFEVAGAIAQSDDYDSLVGAFEAGHNILLLTGTAPLQRLKGLAPHPTTSLVVAMDAQGLSIWWPDTSGHDNNLPRADRKWWREWRAMGVILKQASSKKAADLSRTPEESKPL